MVVLLKYVAGFSARAVRAEKERKKPEMITTRYALAMSSIVETEANTEFKKDDTVSKKRMTKKKKNITVRNFFINITILGNIHIPSLLTTYNSSSLVPYSLPRRSNQVLVYLAAPRGLALPVFSQEFFSIPLILLPLQSIKMSWSLLL